MSAQTTQVCLLPSGLSDWKKHVNFSRSSWCTGKGSGCPTGCPHSPKKQLLFQQHIHTRPRGQGRMFHPLCSQEEFLTQPVPPFSPWHPLVRGLLCRLFPLASGRGFAGLTDRCQVRPFSCQVWEELELCSGSGAVLGRPGINCPPLPPSV